MTEPKLPIRVLHVGDVHLGVELYGRPDPEQGYGTRTADFLGALDRALELAAEADLVLFPGDIYKNCDPSPTIQREFARRIRAVSRHVPVVIIPGNHDLPSVFGRASSVDSAKWEGFTSLPPSTSRVGVRSVRRSAGEC